MFASVIFSAIDFIGLLKRNQADDFFRTIAEANQMLKCQTNVRILHQILDGLYPTSLDGLKISDRSRSYVEVTWNSLSAPRGTRK